MGYGSIEDRAGEDPKEVSSPPPEPVKLNEYLIASVCLGGFINCVQSLSCAIHTQ